MKQRRRERTTCYEVCVESSSGGNDSILSFFSDHRIPNECVCETVSTQGARVSCYVTQKAIAKKLFNALTREFPGVQRFLLPHYTEWQHEWKKNHKPFYLTRRCRIVPAWSIAKCRTTPHDMVIDTTLTFGDGTHPTTRLLAAYLEKFRGYKRVLDVGTGTGILACIAAREGAACVVGLDTEGEAVQYAKKNAKHNKLSARCSFFKKDIARYTVQKPFDMVVANIGFITLVRNKERLIALTASQGMLALSGILKEDARLFSAAFAHPLLRCVRRTYRNEWASFLYQKL